MEYHSKYGTEIILRVHRRDIERARIEPAVNFASRTAPNKAQFDRRRPRRNRRVFRLPGRCARHGVAGTGPAAERRHLFCRQGLLSLAGAGFAPVCRRADARAFRPCLPAR